ncbi:MAG: FAD-dependent oxidoreductase [Actinomycetota bacterium]
MSNTVESFDAIIVGAGPAGSCAALTLAKAGKRVVLIERGPFPGSKNMYGGVVYPRILDALIDEWWTDMPVQRWVTRRTTMLLTETQAVSVDFRTSAWGHAPYNGATTYRPDFDNWLAKKAELAGAVVVCSTTVTGLIRNSLGAVCGVTTDRPNGDLHADVVVACDGVNSFLAKHAGLYTHTESSNFTLGAKETLAIPKHVIDERFGVRGLEGVDIEILGGTGGISGGGFLYTNYDTVGIGVVLKLSQLATQSQRPEQIIANLKAHPAIAPLIEGATLKEYSAHLIPEAGISMMPTFVADGLIIAGDAAAMCLAAGIWLEGVNFAMASGMYAAETIIEALAVGDTSVKGLAGYSKRLENTFVLKDHRKLRRAPQLVLSDRIQHMYPQLMANVAERVFRVDNPLPKPGLRRILADERKRLGVRRRDLLKDAWIGFRSFG